MANVLTLSSPWITYTRKVKALFGDDPEINIVFDQEKNVLKLYVDNSPKAEAISQILPESVTFGNVTLHIIVIPANAGIMNPAENLFVTAFKDNPVVSYIQPIEGIFMNGAVYVVFANKVVQFFNDDLTDIHGAWSGLYENIAEEILTAPNHVFFCTDLPPMSNAPLGEWP